MTMKTKLSILFFALSIVFFSNLSFARAQSNSSDKQVLTMLKEFYTNYITVVSNGAEPKMILSLQKKYCTSDLLKKIPKLIEQSDSDPFLKAQDSNTEFLKTLSIRKDLKKSNTYIVSYIADKKITINLIVIHENETFKIAKVW